MPAWGDACCLIRHLTGRRQPAALVSGNSRPSFYSQTVSGASPLSHLQTILLSKPKDKACSTGFGKTLFLSILLRIPCHLVCTCAHITCLEGLAVSAMTGRAGPIWGQAAMQLPVRHSPRCSQTAHEVHTALSRRTVSAAQLSRKHTASRRQQLTCAAKEDDERDESSPAKSSTDQSADDQASRSQKSRLEDEQSVAQAIGRQLRKRLQMRRVISNLTL
jgi:hypothetical protein